MSLLSTPARVLGALRRYDRRDAAIDALVEDIIRTRSGLLTRLYTGAPAPAPRTYSGPVTAPPQADPLYLEAQLMRDRVELGAEDEPTTREAQHLVSDEFRRLAEELRTSWRSPATPPRRNGPA